MDRSLSSEELAEIERRAEEATPGPWEAGVRYERFGVNQGLRPGEGPYSFLPAGRCHHCAESGEAPIGTERDRFGTVFHVHRVQTGGGKRPSTGWRAISSAGTREVVVESYEGMVSVGIRPADAEFIAGARDDVPRLVEEVKQLRATLERMTQLQRSMEDVGEAARAIRATSARLREQRAGTLEAVRRTRAETERILRGDDPERPLPVRESLES